MSKKEANRLRQVKEVKLKVIEIAMISIAIREFMAHYVSDDTDGDGLFQAYGKLVVRLEKECKR